MVNKKQRIFSKIFQIIIHDKICTILGINSHFHEYLDVIQILMNDIMLQIKANCTQHFYSQIY